MALHHVIGHDTWVCVIHFSVFPAHGVMDGPVLEMKPVVLR